MSRISEFLNSFQTLICVSLPSSLERREHIKQLVERHSVGNFQFFDATSADEAVVESYYASGLVKTYPACFRCGKFTCGEDDCNNTLIPPQVATFISYRRMWEYLIEQGYQSALIIEDDILFTESAETTCEEILSGGWLEQSGLFGQGPMLLRFGWALCEEHKIQTPFRFIPDTRWSNPCHAINRTMARRLLNNFSRIDHTVDVYQHRDQSTVENSKTAIPPLCYEMSWSTGEVDSLIHPKEKRLEYLKSQGLENSASYREVKQRFESHQKHTLYRPILCIGHPACGSKHISDLLQVSGFDVRQNEMGADGISSWMFAVFDNHNPEALNERAESRFFTYFEYVIQFVRDPRTAIPRIIESNVTRADFAEFRRKHILSQLGIDILSYSSDLDSAVASLVFWNKIIESQEPTLVYQIESDDSVLAAFLENSPLANQISNSGKPQRQSLDISPPPDFQFTEVAPHLLDLLNEYCQKYNYRPI